MPQVAKVTVNNNRNEGSVTSGGKIAKDMLKELKNLSGGFGKLLQKSKLDSIFTKGTIGTAALGLAGAAGAISPSSTRMNMDGYSKVNVEGEEKIAQIDDKTGNILELLTIQEATEQKILDDKGNIKLNLRTSSGLWKDSTKNMQKYKDQIILSLAELEKQFSLEAQATEIQKEINEAMKRKARRLGVSNVFGVDLPQSKEDAIAVQIANMRASSEQQKESLTAERNSQTMALLRLSDPRSLIDSNYRFTSSIYRSP